MPERIHLIYRRIPNRILDRYDEVIADLGDVIVARSRFEGMLAPLRVNGVEVIRNGYTMIYFAFIGRNYDILKVYDKEGTFRGLYVDVLAYTKRHENALEMLDLFLDIFIFPNGDAFLLDEDELEMALNYGMIDKKTFDFAYRTAKEILEKAKEGRFPPEIVWKYNLEGKKMSFIKGTKNGTLIKIYVQPKAKKNEIEGVDEWRGRLKVRVKAPPVEGKANKELIKFLSKLLGAEVEILKGETGREKDLLVKGLKPEEVKKKLIG